jgi:hypothetical protein
MSTTTALSAASQIHLSPEYVGILRDVNIPAGSLEEANRLLQKNHETYHMFFRDKAGHNHIAHSILTCLSLGASPSELQRAYDDGVPIQRPIPEVDYQLVQELSNEAKFYDTIGEITQYTTFLVFFQQQIDKKGWKEVVTEYCFSRSRVAEVMLARLYEGAYHPMIHLGLGIEFNQPSIIAEALAQAAAHDSSNIGTFFLNSEQEAAIAYPPQRPKSLVTLLHEVRANDAIRTAPRWEDFGNKMRDGVLQRAGQEMTSLASQFRIKPEELERRTAEMISCCAYMAGAAQRPGRKRKIDFFYMHAVTSSIFFTVLIRQDWISIEDRVRLVEWKGRLDLAWYAVSGCAELHIEDVIDYKDPASTNMDWSALYRAVNLEHDDGHVAKFIRALKNGEEVCRLFEQQWGEMFPIKEDIWLKLARMALDTTKDWPTDLKWVVFTGFDQGWKRPDLA